MTGENDAFHVAIIATSTLSVAGRTAPTASPESMNDTAPGRHWQLHDADWLARRYAQDGDRIIAHELGCSEATVRRAREWHGIRAERRGRRRGSALRVVPSQRAVDSEGAAPAMLAERLAQDRRQRVPATREHLIACCKSWLDAEQHNDQLAAEDALLSIASSALLVHEHQVKLRRAA